MKLRVFTFILLFSQYSTAQVCSREFSSLICKTPVPWASQVRIESLSIHKKAIKYIPNSDIQKASHQDYTRYLTEFERLINSDLKLSQKEIHALFESVKETLLLSISTDPGLTHDVRLQMIANINNSQVLLPSEFAQRANPEDAGYALIMACGFGVQYDNAFTFTKQGWVIVCPARLVRLAIMPASERLLASMRGLSHELGHQIDSDKFSSTYAQWKVCAYSQLKKLKSPIDNYMKELTADYWAAAAVSNYQAKTVRSQNQLSSIQMAYQDVCGLSDIAPQPSGADRINFGLLSQPSFVKLNICVPSTCKL